MNNSTIIGSLAWAMTLLGGIPSQAAPPKAVAPGNNPKAIKPYHIPNLERKGDSRLDEYIPTGSIMPVVNRADATPLFSQPARITPAGASIYGYFLPDGEEDSLPGFYEMNSSYGFDLLWQDVRGLYLYQWLSNGWINDGKLCGYSYFFYPFYVEVDYLNGGGENDTVVELDGLSYFESCTLNSDQGKIYGFGHDANEVYGFGMAYPSNPGDIEIVRQITPEEIDDLWCSSLTYDSYTQTLYGINKKAQLLSIHDDGTQEVVFDTGIPAQYYLTGLTYSPLERVFYWNAILADYSSVIYKIDIENKTSEIVTELPKYTQISFLACADQLMSPMAPAPATFEAFDFPEGSLSGNVSIKMPEKTYGDEPISTPLEYTLLIDNDVCATGKAQGSETVTAHVEDVTQGMHEFGVYVTYDGLESKPVYEERYIGNDTPLAPENVVLDSEGDRLIVTWNAVENGVNGGYLNLADMIYKVTLNTGESLETTDTHCEFIIHDPEQLHAFSVNVIAECNGMESASATSDYVVKGEYLTLPVSCEPTYEQSKLFSMPGEGWSWGEMPSAIDPDKTVGMFNSGYTSGAWLIFPAIKITDASRYYTLTADMASISSNDNIDLEVYCGNSPEPESLNPNHITTVNLPNSDGLTEIVFKMPETGNNYLGIHYVVKSEDSYGAIVSDIKVEDQGITGQSPAAPSISVTDVDEETRKANLSIVLPTTSMSGETLEDTELTVNAECDGTSTATGRPGETITVTVNLPEQEANRITVWAENTEGRSPSAYITAYMDMDVPWTVENLTSTVSEDMLSMTLTWDAPSTNASGGYCNPDNITYEIMALNDEGQYEVIDNIGNAREYTYNYDGPQCNVGIAVLASNKYGDCNYASLANAVLGESYALPMDETFDDPGGLTTEPWNVVSYDEYTYTTNWRFVELRGLFPELAEPADYALTCTPGEYVEYDLTNIGLLSIPRFSTVGVTDATFKATMATVGDTEFTLLGKTYGMDDYVEIGTVSANHELGEVSLTLPEALQGRPWVELMLKCHFAALDDMLVIADVSVTSPNSVKTLWDGNLRILGKEGSIEIVSEEDGVAEIYTMDGKLQGHHAIAEGIINIPASKGVYLVKVGNRRSKVIVR